MPKPTPWRVPLHQKRVAAVEPIAELNRIRVRDNRERLVDALAVLKGVAVHPERKKLLKDSPYRFHGRVTLVAMLQRAQDALPKGHSLMLWGIFRSVQEQEKIYKEVYKGFKKGHPGWPKNILRRQTNRFVHPPDIKTPPGHSTGGAVDLSILGPDGHPFDMTSPFDAESEERRKVVVTFAPLLDERARKNREILIRAMDGAGFTNYCGEWWHWSYGDSCWAWRMRRKTALYGPAALPK